MNEPEFTSDGRRIVKMPSSGALECPRCGCCLSEVYRTKQGIGFVKRERVCKHCYQKFNTHERIFEKGE